MNIELKIEASNSIMQTDLRYFNRMVFNELCPGTEYLHNFHIDVICSEMMYVVEGKILRIIINIPPRYMKSIICSVALPAFILGLNPSASIINVSYSDELATKLARDCKKVMESKWYQELFPKTRISKNKNAAADFETTLGGSRYATSVNGTLTGRGADYIIIDDPIKPIDSCSDTVRKKTNDWYGNTLYSRLNNKNEGKIILIMQRLHDDDLTGHLLNSDPSFKHIKIPAIAEKDELWEHYDRVTKMKWEERRVKGNALHIEREDINKLLDLKNIMGEYSFAGQYQQNPAPLEGGIIKKKWLQFYDSEELYKSIDSGKTVINYVIQSWDTANKIEETNDYSACITMLIDETGQCYIVDCFREKLEFPNLIEKVVQKHKNTLKQFKQKIELLIEEKASGVALLQTLSGQYNIDVQPINPRYDKKARLRSVSPLIENGTCLFPNNNPDWWLDFEYELLRFPNAKHDDQCDALSQALNGRIGFY